MLKRLIESKIFQPEHIPTVPAQFGGIDFETLQVETDDNLRLIGLQHIVNESERTVLFLHGNGGCAMKRAELVAPLADGKTNIIVADYRGYGSNNGKPSEEGLLFDTKAFHNFASKLEKPITILGHSLGGAIAVLYIHKYQIDNIELITFGSPANMTFFVPPILRWVNYPKFDMASIADQMTITWKILHEVDDDIVPINHARHLAEITKDKSNISFHSLSGGNHDLIIKDIEAYLF